MVITGTLLVRASALQSKDIESLTDGSLGVGEYHEQCLYISCRGTSTRELPDYPGSRGCFPELSQAPQPRLDFKEGFSLSTEDYRHYMRQLMATPNLKG